MAGYFNRELRDPPVIHIKIYKIKNLNKSTWLISIEKSRTNCFSNFVTNLLNFMVYNIDLILEMNCWSVIFSRSSENQMIGTIISLKPSAAGTPSILDILMLTWDRIFPLNPLPTFYKEKESYYFRCKRGTFTHWGKRQLFI